MIPFAHRPNPPKRWLPPWTSVRQQRTRTAPLAPLAIAIGQWGLVCGMRSDRIAHFTFSSSTQRRMRSGYIHFGGTATWKGGGNLGPGAEEKVGLGWDWKQKPAGVSGPGG